MPDFCKFVMIEEKSFLKKIHHLGRHPCQKANPDHLPSGFSNGIKTG
jgi:hypothetical protein